MTPEQRTSSQCAVFLDRDGVIIDLVWDDDDQQFEAPLRSEAVELAEGAIDGLRSLKAAGRLLVVVSNQPGVAKGKATVDELSAVHDRVVALLAAEGVTVDEWRYCYHHPNGVVRGLTGDCECRKPKPGMIRDAVDQFDIDLGCSWMVGDSDVDVAAGAAAGCRTMLIEHPRSSHRRSPGTAPDARAADLRAATNAIIDNPR